MSGPRILTLDIETRPPRVWSWGLYNQNIGIEQIDEPGGTMGFGAKWLDKPKVHWHSDFHDGHQQMVQKAWDLLDRADIVIHYNGTKFDIPHLVTEFELDGLPDPSPFAQVDLYKTVKKRFNFVSNKLDFVSQQLGVGAKVKHTGFRMWKECMAGDPKAWALMRRYCIGDVKVEEALYRRLQGRIVGHPHMGLYTGELDMSCQNCGGTDGQYRGYAYTPTGIYRQWRCNADNCGRWSRTARREDGVDLRGVAS